MSMESIYNQLFFIVYISIRKPWKFTVQEFHLEILNIKFFYAKRSKLIAVTGSSKITGKVVSFLSDFEANITDANLEAPSLKLAFQ